MFAVGDFAVAWYVALGDEKNCIGAGGHASTDALGETSKIVGKGFDPDVFVDTRAEVAVFKGFTGDCIDDSVGVCKGWIGAGVPSGVMDC